MFLQHFEKDFESVMFPFALAFKIRSNDWYEV